MAKKKSKAAKKAAAAAATRGVVGPDYMQVLTGNIASKSISLILCGESHHDAIDITRAGGGKIKEGWEPTDFLELTGEMVGKFGGIDDKEGTSTSTSIKCGICKRNNKLLPMGKAKEWGRDIGHEEIDYIDHGHEMVLLWVPSKDNSGAKGKAFLVELFLEESENKEDKSRSHHPPEVVDLLDSMANVAKSMKGAKSLSEVVHNMKDGTTPGFEKPNHTLLVWADIDTEARLLNHRRLLGEDISTTEYDTIIGTRKTKRRAGDNIWTWDDWLVEIQSKISNANDAAEDNPALHVILESSVPPWEVELCRDMKDFELAEAADCIRCLSEDSEESKADAYDPSSDGFGSYIDYIYRRLLAVERAKHGDGDGPGSHFLHCVDCRDLGCEHACIEDSLHKDWMGLLGPEEREKLLGSGPDAPHAHHKNGRCLPDWSHNPEESKLDELRSTGELKNDDTDDEDSKEDYADDLITFPSMESFFGQCTDLMYYTPHCKAAYAPFLAKCVKSLGIWNSFFVELFFGGTVSDALSLLDLSRSNYLHVRSPIMKYWNAQTGEYEWHKRENEESDVTLPLLPIKSFLKARGSSPARTWCSNIFDSLLKGECEELKALAIDTREWALKDIAKHCENPKQSDDEIGGGEWFLAYLRQCHREIYDDIDISDPPTLLRKQNAIGESNKKHRLADINIPNCTKGFQLITEELLQLEDKKSEKPTLSNQSEVLAKILIDIYMNKMIDASTMAKLAQIVSKETNSQIVFVCYMGSCHTRAICDFFTQPKYGFKKKMFAGKQNWDEDEGRIIHLPAELWNLKTLFK